MAIWDSVFDRIAERLTAGIVDRMAAKPIIEARAYRSGYYKPQLRVSPNQFDDNIGINLTGLLVNRIVSQTIGAGFELDFDGETETANEQYIRAVLDANKQEVLFHRCCVAAAEAGTGYLMIIPDAVTGPNGEVLPRLQLVDPTLVTIETLPEDFEIVLRYTIQYKFIGANGKEQARRRVIERATPNTVDLIANETWVINDYEQGANGQWVLVASTPWLQDFPAMLHWQNLPSIRDAYGEPDLTPAQIELQNRINFVASNISKLIRYYAHPMRFSVNAKFEKLDVGPDKVVALTGDNADIRQLEALGDLSASMAYLTTLRQAFFACGRVVDIDSIHDKLGALTNFGLRVLYADNLNLISTHRELFGDALEELVRRLQVLAGMTPVPCSVVWPDFLPVNETEEQTALAGDLANGLVSKQTAAGKRGYDWDAEQERIAAEGQQDTNLGAALLRAFDRGEGVE